MTTVYVNKRLGLAITDSRASWDMERYLFGFFPLTPVLKTQVVNQKAIYIHDRLFLSTGSVPLINKVAQYLCTGDPIENINKNHSCDCLLIGDNYTIELRIRNGKIRKRVMFPRSDWVYIMGSGCNILNNLIKNNSTITADELFETFRQVTKFDKYSDDNINLYRI